MHTHATHHLFYMTHWCPCLYLVCLSKVLRTPQPGAIRKPSQVSLTTTPMVTLRAQPQNRVLVGPPSKLITGVYLPLCLCGVIV